MHEFNSWTEINWYALGSLLAQFAFLAAGIWFARNILRTVRAFLEQVGALLKLSITGNPSEPHAASAHSARSFAETSPYWLAPNEPQPDSPAQPVKTGPGAWRRMVLWLNEPMRTAEVSAWRRAINWLQAPSGS
ncbi:MAG TPA: hypothetical protein VEI54_07320 [Candidatus Limnocylindrales bacterium]|nr:hypothetical protein [Candidatus Limnocylindrales bacterium]